jgi:outer membrane protein TolC
MIAIAAAVLAGASPAAAQVAGSAPPGGWMHGRPNAEVAPARALTLQEAIDEALAHNQQLAIAGAGVDAAAAGAREAAAGRLPRIDVSYTYQRTTNPVYVFGNLLRQRRFGLEHLDPDTLNEPAPLDNFSPQVSIVQPIWTGGRLERGHEAAELAHEAARLQQARTEQEVVFQTTQAYGDAVVAVRHLDVAAEALDTALAHVELAGNLRRGGLVVESDLLQARVRASEVEEAMARANSAVAVTKAALNLSMGRDVREPITLPAELAGGRIDSPDIGALIDEALAARPDLRAAAALEGAAGKKVDVERGAYWPEVAFSAAAESSSASMFGAQGTNWSLILGARFTVFDGNARNAAVARALAQRREAEERRVALQQSIGLAVVQAASELRAAGQRMALAAGAVELARENLRIVENRYREGLTTSVELLDAQAALTAARTRVVAADRDVMVGRAALDLAVGR